MGANYCICKDMFKSKGKKSCEDSKEHSDFALSYRPLVEYSEENKNSKKDQGDKIQLKMNLTHESIFQNSGMEEDHNGSERFNIFETYKNNSGLWRDSTHFAEEKIQQKLGIKVNEESIKKYYKIGSNIGKGSYAIVKQGHSLAHPSFKVAIKIYNLDCYKADQLSILREISALNSFDHPGLVKVHEVFKNKNKIYIICDLVKGKQLYDFILESKKLSENDTRIIIQQLLGVIKYTHSKNIMHRDLKPENIIIDQETLHIKVIDFGSSNYFSDNFTRETCLGTPYYIAPEVLKGEYGKEADVWSIGIITYLMLTSCPPFQDENFQVIYQKIIHDPVPFYRDQWMNLSQNSMKFVKLLLAKDPEERMTTEEALSHPWMDGIDEEPFQVNYSVLEKIINRPQPNILCQEILHLCSSQINPKLLQKWNKLYIQIHSSKSGMGSLQKLFDDYKQTVNLKDVRCTSEYLEILKKLSHSSSTHISYSDFLSTVIDFENDVTFCNLQALLSHMEISEKEDVTLEQVQEYAQRKNYSIETTEILYQQIKEQLGDLEKVIHQQTQNISQNTLCDDSGSVMGTYESKIFASRNTMEA